VKIAANVDMTMAITVKFFASLREQIGKESLQLALPAGASAAAVWHAATEGRPLPPNVLVAINMEYAQALDPVQDGDEVAFFPPVTGGAR
jgi:molybdopterin synthase sulfur carrier subunit